MEDYDIDIYQGSTFNLMVTINDDGGSPIDLTGYTFRGQIKEFTGGPVKANFSYTLQTQSGGTLGQVLIYMTATETAAIDLGEGPKHHRKSTIMLYDIEGVNGTEVTRYLQGKATIIPEVTT